MDQIVFFVLAAITLASAVYFVVAKNPLYAILSLVVTFFSISGFYLMVNAQFLFIIQIIVYAGAIMVLFLYILMMLNLNKIDDVKKHNANKFIGVFATCILFLGLLGDYKGLSGNTVATSGDTTVGLTKNLGKLLFNEYVLPFEFASILILAGIVGAVLVGKRDL